MSLRDIEAKTGVSDSTLSRVRRMNMYDYTLGSYRPSWETLNAILRYEHPTQPRLPGL